MDIITRVVIFDVYRFFENLLSFTEKDQVEVSVEGQDKAKKEIVVRNVGGKNNGKKYSSILFVKPLITSPQ